MVLLGLLIAIPAWVLVGRVFGGWVGRTYDLPVPEILRSTDHDDDAAAFRSDPTVRTTLSLLALPLVLIFLNTRPQRAGDRRGRLAGGRLGPRAAPAR